MKYLYVTIFTVLISLLVWLVNLASTGSVVAAYTLGIVTVLIIFILFQTATLITTWLHTRAESHRFQQNVHENVMLMHKAWQAQNAQLRAHQQAGKLFGPIESSEPLVDIDYSIFSETIDTE